MASDVWWVVESGNSASLRTVPVHHCLPPQLGPLSLLLPEPGCVSASLEVGSSALQGFQSQGVSLWVAGRPSSSEFFIRFGFLWQEFHEPENILTVDRSAISTFVHFWLVAWAKWALGKRVLICLGANVGGDRLHSKRWILQGRNWELEWFWFCVPWCRWWAPWMESQIPPKVCNSLLLRVFSLQIFFHVWASDSFSRSHEKDQAQRQKCRAMK